LVPRACAVERALSPDQDLGRQANRLVQRHKAMRASADDVRDQIKELRRKVALARDEANRVKVGMEFDGNQWLRLKNPENLQEAATYTRLSLYLKTDKPEGTVAYLGNERGSASRARRAREDDFMALLLKGGYPVLIINLGDGTEEIRHDQRVADNQWHQIIIDRTGKTVSLEVRTEGEPENIKTKYLQGTQSVFNLDQVLSKFYLGGLPPDEQVSHH
ncbi:unnamed protein product, partial [Ixodes hexagonus]